jgi:hypothetical protein
MFTRRASDEDWIKYLLNTGLVTVDQYQSMRGNQNQVDVTTLLCANASLFSDDLWVNKALQQDRFHYIPDYDGSIQEIAALNQIQPLLLARCINEQIIPLSYRDQVLYLGLLRYDANFPELNDIVASVPPDITVCLIPLGPNSFADASKRVRSISLH